MLAGGHPHPLRFGRFLPQLTKAFLTFTRLSVARANGDSLGSCCVAVWSGKGMKFKARWSCGQTPVSSNSVPLRDHTSVRIGVNLRKTHSSVPGTQPAQFMMTNFVNAFHWHPSVFLLLRLPIRSALCFFLTPLFGFLLSSNFLVSTFHPQPTSRLIPCKYCLSFRVFMI